jgi:hypothetical protein
LIYFQFEFLRNASAFILLVDLKDESMIEMIGKAYSIASTETKHQTCLLVIGKKKSHHLEDPDEKLKDKSDKILGKLNQMLDNQPIIAEMDEMKVETIIVDLINKLTQRVFEKIK